MNQSPSHLEEMLLLLCCKMRHSRRQTTQAHVAAQVNCSRIVTGPGAARPEVGNTSRCVSGPGRADRPDARMTDCRCTGTQTERGERKLDLAKLILVRQFKVYMNERHINTI